MGKTEEAVNVATVYVVDDDDGMRRALNLLLNTVGVQHRGLCEPQEILGQILAGYGGLPRARYPHAGHERARIAAESESHGLHLGVSERTMEIHRAKVMERMDARSVAHLVKLQMSLSNDT
jgi:FixJ family two-component response regulator